MVLTPSITLVSPVTVLITLRVLVPSGETTLPVVVYGMPGSRGNHLFSISGLGGKALRLKLIAEPGPPRAWERAAAGAAAAVAAAAVAAVSDATTSKTAEP